LRVARRADIMGSMSDQGPSPRPPPSGLCKQTAAVLVALALWALWPGASLLSLLGSYVLALGLCNLVLLLAPSFWPSFTSRSQGVALACLLGLAPAAALVHKLEPVEETERLAGLPEHAADRRRIDALPAIAPAVLFLDHPQRFFVHAPGAEKVEVAWVEGKPPLAAVALGEGLFRLAYDPQAGLAAPPGPGPFAVSLFVDGAVHTRAMTAILPEPHPRWFASVPQAGIAATVSEETDEAILVWRDGRLRRVPVGDGPSDCVLFAGGKGLAVCHRYTGEIWLIDSESGAVARKLPTARFQTRLAASPDESVLAVAVDGVERGIHIVGLPDGARSSFVPLKFSPDWLCFGRTASEIVVTCRRDRTIHRLAPQTSGIAPVEPIRLSRPVVAMGRAPDGRAVLAATTATGAAEHTGHHLVVNALLRIDVDAWRIGATIVTDKRSDEQDMPGSTDRGVSPMGIAPFGGKSFLVAFAGTDEVWELPFAAGGGGPAAHYLHASGIRAPHGVADLGEGWWCVSSPSEGSISVLEPTGQLAKVHRLSPERSELAVRDPAALLRRQGEQTFHEATRAGLSCQSCHLHAGSDGCRHNLGGGALVATRSVFGIAGTAPYLHDGSHPRLQDLHDVAAGIYRGYAWPADFDRALALAAYMEALPLPVNPRALSPADLARERAGVAAFVKARCVSCHSFPAFTNLSQHPNRFVFPEILPGPGVLDTPSLRAVAEHAPYLFDSRASTLEEVIDRWNSSNRHGDVRALSQDERAALIQLLETL